MIACLIQRLKDMWAEFRRRNDACHGESLMKRTGRLYWD